MPWDGALSTKSGGMSYQMLESADPEHELDVIKAILLREVRACVAPLWGTITICVCKALSFSFSNATKSDPVWRCCGA